MSIPANR